MVEDVRAKSFGSRGRAERSWAVGNDLREGAGNRLDIWHLNGSLRTYAC